MIYFTSDLHFGHAKIIDMSKRPFDNLDDMNAGLITNWNKVVQPEDLVYDLGDFSLHEPYEIFEKQLNGHIMHIRGNHDKKSWMHFGQLETHGLIIWMQHQPRIRQEEVSIDTDLVLCGHVHELWRTKEIDYPQKKSTLPMINVGVDQWDYMPVSIDEIVKLYHKIKK